MRGGPGTLASTHPSQSATLLSAETGVGRRLHAFDKTPVPSIMFGFSVVLRSGRTFCANSSAARRTSLNFPGPRTRKG